MRFSTWNLKSRYRLESLKTVARELAEYELYLVGVQEVWWGKGELLEHGILPYFFSMEKTMKIIKYE
jgi:hypothetical protein